MQKLQTTTLQDVEKLTPGLTFGPAPSVNGVQVSLRGIGTTSSSVGVDQSVSLYIDGLQLGHGLAFTSGLFDLGQVEILKGPQALFYGKASTGGMISLRTADPTNKAELIASTGYEFEAREKRAELILSGPVSETLKLRLASMYSDSDGFFKNEAIGDPLFGGVTPRSRAPAQKSYVIRGTALWNPSSTFSARLKLNYVKDKTLTPTPSQTGSCPDGTGAPFGVPFIAPDEDCKVDRVIRTVDMDPAFFRESRTTKSKTSA